MGNQCAGSQAHAPRRQESASREPPLVIKSPVLMTPDELETKNSQLISMQLQAFEASKQGKHLAEALSNERKKAASLVQSVSDKVRQIREELQRFAAEDGSISQEGVDFIRSKRADIEECMSALGNLCKTALTRTEEQFKKFVQKQEKVHQGLNEIASTVADSRFNPNLTQSHTLKLAEMDQISTKIASLQDDSRKSLADIESSRAAIEKSLKEVPAIMGEMANFVKVDVGADSEGEVIVKEQEMSFDSTPVDSRVVVMMEAEEEHVTEEIQEEELAAEAAESAPEPQFEEILFSSAASTISEALLSQIAPPESLTVLPTFSLSDIYLIFNQILGRKFNIDSVQPGQPMPIDICTLDFFTEKYGDSAMAALGEFSKQLQELQTSGAEFTQFISDVMGIGCKQTYAKVITDRLAMFARAVGQAIEGKERAKQALSMETMGAEERAKGGSLHLADVLRTFAPLLSEFPEYGARFLERIHPPGGQHTDFLHFVLIHHMRAANIDGISLFKHLSEDNVLSFAEFGEGVREKLNWKISDESLEKLFYMIQNPDTGVIHRLDFIRFLRLQLYFENAQNPAFEIPKMQILQAFAEVCVMRRKELITCLYSKLRELPSDTLTLEGASKVLLDLGETRDTSEVLKSLTDNKVSFEDFVKLVEARGLKIAEKPYFVLEAEKAMTLAETPELVAKMIGTQVEA